MSHRYHAYTAPRDQPSGKHNLAITAKSATIDDPALLPPAKPAGGPLPAAGASGPAPGAPPVGSQTPPPTVSITGTVTALNPFVLTLDNGLAISVTLPEDALVYQVKQITLADLKVGEPIWALGETGPDRALNPRYVFVYATQPSLPAP